MERPTLRQTVNAAIRQALKDTQGHKPRAAKQLGISLKTLYNKINSGQLDLPEKPVPVPLDTKFYGVVHRARDNRVEPPDGFMVFVARDNALIPTLKFYREECLRQEASATQIEGIDRLIERVRAWRLANPEQCKIADMEPREL